MTLQLQPLLTEETVNLLTTQIKSNFNALVADADNKYKDGIGIEVLDFNNIYISDKLQPLNTPSVFILFNEHAFAYTNDPNYLDSEDRCVIVVTSEHVGADALTRKMWRYARVIFSCFNLVSMESSDGRLQINTIPSRLGYTQPISSKLGKESQMFRMDCVLELRIKHFEKNLI